MVVFSLSVIDIVAGRDDCAVFSGHQMYSIQVAMQKVDLTQTCVVLRLAVAAAAKLTGLQFKLTDVLQ